MMRRRRRTAGQSNLEAPSIGAMAGEYPTVGVALAVHWGPSSTGRDVTHLALSPSPGALLYPQQPAVEGRHHGIPVEVQSILLPPATLECFAFD